jgi:quercetin dioxygenase-like cupin family protein
VIPAIAIPTFLSPAEGRTYLVCDRVAFRAVPSDPGAAYALYEAVVARGGGMPPHLHRYEDEAFFVLGGTFAITIGGQTVTGGRGVYAFGPRGVPHAFQNVGETPGRLLAIVSPGALQEQFLAEVGRPVGKSGTAAVARARPASQQELAWIAARAEKYGVEFLPGRRA